MKPIAPTHSTKYQREPSTDVSLRVTNRLLTSSRLLLSGILMGFAGGVHAATPVAHDDLIMVGQDASIVIDYLLLNDSDADGDVLSISSTTAPGNGALVDNGGGSYTYTPGTGYTGSDSFDYTISDGNGGSDTGTVELSVNATIDGEAARDDILNGVTQLVDPTQAGHMVVFGPTAYSISNTAIPQSR